jgi:hypothetical protein
MQLENPNNELDHFREIKKLIAKKLAIVASSPKCMG